MARNAIETADIISGASQWLVCKPFGDIPSICPRANTPILVFLWYALFVNKYIITLFFENIDNFNSI